MKLLFVAIAAVVVGVLGVNVVSDAAIQARCETGKAQGFASIEWDDQYLVGRLPSSFTSDPAYFRVQYNCRGRGVQARRLGLGLYEVRFPGAGTRLGLATAISQEGVSVSVHPLDDGTFRVALRGPLGGELVASRRDVPFSIVIY